MVETITQGRDIGPLWLRVPEAIAGAIVIAPSAYLRLTYGYTGGASDNWDEVAVSLDLVNWMRRQPVAAPISVLLAFVRAKLQDRRMMQKEFGSWIYLDMHATPAVVQYAIARKMALTDPGTWQPIADGLRGWLRALVGWLAWTGCWGPGKQWAQDVATAGPGARLLVGRGGYSKRVGAVAWTTLCGKRSWEFSGEWRENAFGPMLLSFLGLGIRLRQGDIWKSFNALIDAVEKTYGVPIEVLTPAERSTVLAATRNDVTALAWVAENLIGDWLPADPTITIRAARGVSHTHLEADKAATATLYHCGWDEDGTTYGAGACTGGRGGHGEQIEPGHARVDLASRTGFCQRTEGPDRVRVGFPLPKGDLVAVLEAQHGRGRRARFFRNGVEVGTPAPEPDRPPAVDQDTPPTDSGGSFIRRWWRRLRRGRR